MRPLIKAVCGVLLCATQILSVTAQNRNDRKRIEPRAKTQSNLTDGTLTPDQQVALSLLDQLLGYVKTLDNAQLKLSTQAQVADILWRYDEPRARHLFEGTFRAIASAKADNQSSAPTVLTIASASPLSQLQGDVLSLVARHDANLAEKLINSLADAQSKEGGDSKARSDNFRAERSGLYLKAAISIAETNPERAVQLAQASLINGIDPSILSVLFALRQKNPAQATTLYRSTLAAARGDAQHASVNIQILASYALPEFTTAGMSEGNGLLQNSGAMTRHDSAMTAEFLNFVYGTFLQLSNPAQLQTANPVDYMTGQRLLPFFVRLMPERAPMFRNMLDIMAQKTSQSGAVAVVNTMFQPAEPDDLLKQAEKTQDQFQRDLLYFRAITTLAAKGELDTALSLVGKVSDSDFRGGLDSLVRFQAASSLLNKGDIDSAIRYAKGISDGRHRAFLLAKAARILFNKNEPVRAAEILADADQIIRKSDEGEQKAHALLLIAETESRIDPRRGFEVMEATTKAFNDADFKAEEKQPEAKPGAGFNLSAMLTKIFKLETPDLAPSFSLLARTDFNRALLLAQTFKKKDRAVLAQLAVCRSVLAPKRVKKM